jgi:acetyl-CoA carboxylase carboxyl transferase subunit beta
MLIVDPLVSSVLDLGSLRSWDEPPVGVAVSGSYRDALAAARERSGADEAVLTEEGRIGGRPVSVIYSEFGFLAGSIGVATSERIVRAVERATAERLPLLAATASGGTRMQEGTLAFLRMATITAAIGAHKAAGLPYLVYLRNPTTGGVYASWGSLGHMTVAEPGALIGFLGPRVHAALHGAPLPPGVQTAENLFAHGLVDAVLPPEQLAGVAARVLAVLDAPAREPASVPTCGPEAPEPSAWEAITATRRPDRPGVRDVLRIAATDVIPLAGTGEGESGAGLLLALVRFGAASCVLLGQDRRVQARTPLGPGALRTARRGMRLAAELGLPLVTVIDTPGGAIDTDAEQGGMAGEIARCLADLVALPVPTVSMVLGQGTGGAALALLPADRVLASRLGWISPLPVEGAAVILHRDAGRAPEVADLQGVRAGDMFRAGAVDHVVPERPDAADEPQDYCRRVAAAIEGHTLDLVRVPAAERLESRRVRLRLLGLAGS